MSTHMLVHISTHTSTHMSTHMSTHSNVLHAVSAGHIVWQFYQYLLSYIPGLNTVTTIYNPALKITVSRCCYEQVLIVTVISYE